VNVRLLALLGLSLLAAPGCDGHALPVFTLQVEVPAPAVQRGTSTEIPFQVARSGPAQPVQVFLREPPAGVSVEPIHVRADQDSGVLHVHASDQTAVGDYTLDVVATGFSRDDTDSILLQVKDIPASAPMVVVTEQQAPVLVKGGTTGVSFQVDRSGGFSGSFRVEPEGPLPQALLALGDGLHRRAGQGGDALYLDGASALQLLPVFHGPGHPRHPVLIQGQVRITLPLNLRSHTSAPRRVSARAPSLPSATLFHSWPFQWSSECPWLATSPPLK